jgi:hypothetical protein
MAGNSHIQANVIGAGIDQRTKSLASNRRIILKNQIDRRLHAHGDGELSGSGLRSSAGDHTKHADQDQQCFLSAELKIFAHLIRTS